MFKLHPLCIKLFNFILITGIKVETKMTKGLLEKEELREVVAEMKDKMKMLIKKFSKAKKLANSYILSLDLELTLVVVK